MRMSGLAGEAHELVPERKKNQSSGYSFEVLLKQIEEEKRVKDITPGRE